MKDGKLTPRSDFEKLMSQLTSDYSNARMAIEMYNLGVYQLSAVEKVEARQAIVKAIIMGSDEPARDLMDIDFDFHQVFEHVFGFSPPRSEEFKLWGGKRGGIGPGSGQQTLSLRTTVYGEGPDVPQRVGHDVEFEFWWDMQSYDEDDWDQDPSLDPKNSLEPWFRFETMHGKDGYVTFEKGVISIDEGDDYSTRSSKEQLPSALRSAMGLPWDADISGWPELPLGSPPKEGSDIEGPVDPPYEGKRKLDKNYLFEAINEVLQETEEHELSEKQKIENMIRSNNGEDFVWGLEMCHMLACSTQVPQIINSQVMSGKYAGNDWVFLLVKTEKEAQDLHWYLRAMRPKSSMPSRKNRGAYMFYWPASEGSPFRVDIDMEHEEGDYIVEIVLDLPDYEMTSWGSVRWLQENLIREDEEEDPYDQISNKIDAFIGSNDLG